MFKLLLILAYCFHFTLNGFEDPNFEESPFQIEFDDFPDNSTPDLERLFEKSCYPIPKELKDFISISDPSEIIKEQDQFGVDFHGFPSAIVNGCVNVISGEYQENTVDFALPGSIPFEIQRFYCGSNKCKKHSFLYGWQLNHGAKLLFYRSKHHHDNAILKGSDRHGVHFKGPRHQKELYCADSFFKKGVANCSLGEINASTNFKNDCLHKSYGAFELETANRTLYSFEKSSHDPEREGGTHAYRLENVNLPNGNSYQYTYGRTLGMPICIRVMNRQGKETASIRLDRHTDFRNFQYNPELVYETTTGEKLRYRFMLYGEHKRAILSEVIPPHSPKIKYTYEAIRGHYKQKRIWKRELPENRVLEITYDKKDRVKELLAPAGLGQELIPTHTFNYYKYGKIAYAEVQNALRGIKTYSWDMKTKRLVSIETLQSNQSSFLTERFKWGNDYKDESHLTARILEDQNGALIAYHKYSYDVYGNILCSSLYGNFTGKSEAYHFIGTDLKPPSSKKCEVFRTFYEYDEHQRKISENDGRVVHRYAYLRDTNLLSADYTFYDDRIQLRHFYRYDASGAICEEITDDGSGLSRTDLTNVTERHIKICVHSPIGLPEVVREYCLNLSNGEQELIQKSTNKYDNHGWLIAQSVYDSNRALAYQLEWQYDSHGNVIWEKDAFGYATTSKYDANDNLIYEEKPGLAPKIFTYDCMNRLIEERQGDQSKSYRYDVMGNCIAAIDIYGNKTQHIYDEHGRLLQTIYPGVSKNPVVHYTRNSLGAVSSMTDPNGHTCTIQYNVYGKPTLITYPDGHSEKNLYTLWGDVAETIAKDGTKTCFTYDSQGREVKKEWFDRSGNFLKSTTKEYNALHLLRETDASGIETHYTYDAAGRLSSEKTLDRTILYAYDTLGRKTSTTQLLADGSTISSIEKFDVVDRVIESYILDSHGVISNRLVKSYDPQGNEISSEQWNQAGSAVSIAEHDLFGRVTCVTNALGESTHTTYPLGKKPMQEVTDPRGVKTVTTFDPFGHPILEQKFDIMGQLVEEIAYQYDLNGNKIQRKITTEKDPIITNWHYDNLNQLKETVEAFGAPEQKRVERRYDALGRVVQLIKNDGTVFTYEYDFLGRRTSMRSSDGAISYSYFYDISDNLLEAKDNILGTSIKRTYDSHGQLITDSLPYGQIFSYTYDAIGNVEQVILPDNTTIQYSYKGIHLDTIHRQGKDSYQHKYLTYDASSNPIDIQFSKNAGKLQIDYDQLNRPIAIQAPHWQEALSFDAHLLSRRALQDTFGENLSNYAYDAKSQLLTENGTANHQFAYDWQGNPVMYDGAERQFNACNALLQDHKRQFTHDKNGNRINDGTNTFAYDALDRLVEAKTKSGTYRYVYDALGRRIARIHDQKTTYFLWQADQEIGTIENGVIAELKVLNPGNHAVALELNQTLYIPIHDIFGHVRALLNCEGKCVATYRYSAFGEEQVEGVLCPWRYAGKRIDSETGFIYFGERYYDPTSLCWITSDPMEDADGPNLYAYVHNNPFLYVDPDGCLSWDWLDSGWGQAALTLAEVGLAASVIGWGAAGIAEGFLAGVSGGVTGTAVDLAFDACSLYGQESLAVACAESTSVSYNACKTAGRFAGAAFSCTPMGKTVQTGMNMTSMATSVAKGAKTAVQVSKNASKTKTAATIAANSVKSTDKAQKLISFTPEIVEGNRKSGLAHIIRRHAHDTNEKFVSKFSKGIGTKEISEFVTEGCKKANWTMSHGFHTAVVDTGKIIGTEREYGLPTSKMLIILKGIKLHTAYPTY